MDSVDSVSPSDHKMNHGYGRASLNVSRPYPWFITWSEGETGTDVILKMVKKSYVIFFFLSERCPKSKL